MSRVDFVCDPKGNKNRPYLLRTGFSHYCRKYNRFVICQEGMRSDGATGAMDIDSKAWWVHDQLCRDGTFACGSKCTNLQASTVLYNILKDEGYWFRARTWFIMTLAFGGGKARRNGIL